jgi:transcriptional regulator with XRE-family HTH domain
MTRLRVSNQRKNSRQSLGEAKSLMDGAELKALRGARGLTQTKLAAAAGIALTTLNRIETGRCVCQIGTELKIAAALGIGNEVLEQIKNDGKNDPAGLRLKARVQLDRLDPSKFGLAYDLLRALSKYDPEVKKPTEVKSQ